MRDARPGTTGQGVIPFVILCLVILGAGSWSGDAAAAEDAQPLRLAFHVHTGVSDGAWTARQVLQEAQRLGLDGVVFADSLIERWEFGLPPLRRLARRVIEHPSVLRWGAASYLQHLDDVAAKFPQLIVLPGVTVSPFYRWTDVPLFRGGRLESWHRQLLIFGVDDPRVLSDLPVVSNAYASWRVALRHPWRLWPLLLVLAGVVGWRRRPRGARTRWGSLLVLLVGLLLLGNAEPRRTTEFHPYQPDPGPRPYQEVIDYIIHHGGVAVWLHPALTSEGAFGGVPVVTSPSPELLLQTHGYLGVGVNYWSEIKPLAPGREWDQVLLAYCQGKRPQPVWVLGEIGFHDPSRPLNMVQTIVYAGARTPAAILDAMRRGRMYAQFNAGDTPVVSLTAYAVADATTQQRAGMGETLQNAGQIHLVLSGTQPPGESATTITLIRNGVAVHQEQVADTSFTWEWREALPPAPQVWYYRVMLQRGTGLILTNPTFVRPRVPPSSS